MLLLLSPRRNPSSVLIEQAAEKQGWEVRRLSNWRAPLDINVDTGVVAYGEPLFVAAMADALGLALIEPPFDWLAILPIRYTKRHVRFLTLEQARNEQGPVFAKPADDKCFPAGVYESGADIKASDLLPAELPVLVSEVVEWEVEYRFFVCDRAVVASSVYLRHGELVDFQNTQFDFSDIEGLAFFVQDFLSDKAVALPPAVVIDVGKIRGIGWAILEANPVFGSGLYDCEPQAVLKALARSVIAAKEVKSEERKYVLNRTN